MRKLSPERRHNKVPHSRGLLNSVGPDSGVPASFFFAVNQNALYQWIVDTDQELIEFVKRGGSNCTIGPSGRPHPPTPLAARLIKKRPPPPRRPLRFWSPATLLIPTCGSREILPSFVGTPRADYGPMS